MISPAHRLPAAPIFKVSAIAIRRAIDLDLQNEEMQLLCETNEFFILFTIILYAADRRARGQKVCFVSEYLCFLCGRCVESTRTDPSYPLIFFSPMPPMSSSCFGMISDEGGRVP